MMGRCIKTAMTYGSMLWHLKMDVLDECALYCWSRKGRMDGWVSDMDTLDLDRALGMEFCVVLSWLGIIKM